MLDQNDLTPKTGLRGLSAQLVNELDRRYAFYLQGTPYEHVRPFDVKVFVVAAREGRTESEIARLFSVSRQAVHAAVNRLIATNFVERRLMSGNGRDKQIVITAYGQKAMETANEHIFHVEGECAAIIGAENMPLLRRQLALIAEGLKLRNAPKPPA
jgi:DNA-binding MarR family transcriptional regulator